MNYRHNFHRMDHLGHSSMNASLRKTFSQPAAMQRTVASKKKANTIDIPSRYSLSRCFTGSFLSLFQSIAARDGMCVHGLWVLRVSSVSKLVSQNKVTGDFIVSGSNGLRLVLLLKPCAYPGNNSSAVIFWCNLERDIWWYKVNRPVLNYILWLIVNLQKSLPRNKYCKVNRWYIQMTSSDCIR